MLNISLRDLLEAGVHFGHQTGRWNPRMKPYIYGAKDGVHIVDLQKTAKGLVDASRFTAATLASGKHILFVGTKRAARDIIKEEAVRCDMFYINHRWLGGTMTNWNTVKQSIDRLLKLEHWRDEGRFDLLTKKEALELTREIAKMDRVLGGIKTMKRLPSALFVIDPKKEHIAIKEANILKIPVIGVCDTNCDPAGIDYVIPGNDDAIKAVRLYTAAIADSVIAGRSRSTQRTGGSWVAPQHAAEVVERRVAPPEEAAAPEAAPPEAAPPEAAPPAPTPEA